jgi:hypothetical protein
MQPSTTTIRLLLVLLPCARGLEIPFVTFDNATGTTFPFTALVDPVMGSQSWGNWTVDADGDGGGVLSGVVTVVPRPAVSIVGASPGFLKAAADGAFPDISRCAAGGAGGLVLSLRVSGLPYPEYHVSLASGAHPSASYSCKGGGSIPLSRGCFKANFTAAASASSAFTPVFVPFAAFSDRWTPKTGEATVGCADDGTACLTAARLASVQRVEIWAEGSTGHVHLEVGSIVATSERPMER